jgi:hypothetical protein
VKATPDILQNRIWLNVDGIRGDQDTVVLLYRFHDIYARHMSSLQLVRPPAVGQRRRIALFNLHNLDTETWDPDGEDSEILNGTLEADYDVDGFRLTTFLQSNSPSV